MVMAVIFTAALAPEMAYSAYTNQPGFICPGGLKCALYQASDRWKPLEHPILKVECLSGQKCGLVSLSKPGNSIRWLPGDIWMSAYRFEGWVLFEEGQNPYPDVTEPEPEPEPTPDPPVCTKVCRNKSIHGICTGYKIVCETVS